MLFKNDYTSHDYVVMKPIKKVPHLAACKVPHSCGRPANTALRQCGQSNLNMLNYTTVYCAPNLNYNLTNFV